MKSKLKLALVAGAIVASSVSGAMAGKDLDAIKARGELLCGVSGTLGGFSLPDSKGVMQGLDADICRAIAAAIGTCTGRDGVTEVIAPHGVVCQVGYAV